MNKTGIRGEIPTPNSGIFSQDKSTPISDPIQFNAIFAYKIQKAIDT